MTLYDLATLELSGPTVRLAPLSLVHLADCARVADDPALWTWWVREPPRDEAGMRREIEHALALKARGMRLPFAIVRHADGACIGSTSYLAFEPAHRSIEIGATWLASAHHGGGINRECKQLLFGFAFERLGINRVVLQTDALNLRSRRAIEKLGAHLDGILREERVLWNGRVRSSAVYSLLRAEWPGTRA
ncbi:MAG: GNAT family N-acetyltransferase [Gammaproteobacteria bacterium]